MGIGLTVVAKGNPRLDYAKKYHDIERRMRHSAVSRLGLCSFVSQR